MWMRVTRTGVRVLLLASVLLAACNPAAPVPVSTPQAQQQQPRMAPASSIGLIFFSNQFKPVEEQGKMQDVILKDAPVRTEYIPEDPGPFNDRLNAEEKAGRVTVSLIGGLHGDFEPFARAGYLEDLTPVAQKLSDRGFAPAFMDLAHLGTRDKTYYIPW